MQLADILTTPHAGVVSSWEFDTLASPEPGAAYLDAIDRMRGNDRAPSARGETTMSALMQARFAASDPEYGSILSIEEQLPYEQHDIEFVLDDDGHTLRHRSQIGLEEHLLESLMDDDMPEHLLGDGLWDEAAGALAAQIARDTPCEIVLAPPLDSPHDWPVEVAHLAALGVEQGLTALDEIVPGEPTIVCEITGPGSVMLREQLELANELRFFGEHDRAYRRTLRALHDARRVRPDWQPVRRSKLPPSPVAPAPAFRQTAQDRRISALIDADMAAQAQRERDEAAAERKERQAMQAAYPTQMSLRPTRRLCAIHRVNPTTGQVWASSPVWKGRDGTWRATTRSIDIDGHLMPTIVDQDARNARILESLLREPRPTRPSNGAWNPRRLQHELAKDREPRTPWNEQEWRLNSALDLLAYQNPSPRLQALIDDIITRLVDTSLA